MLSGGIAYLLHGDLAALVKLLGRNVEQVSGSVQVLGGGNDERNFWIHRGLVIRNKRLPLYAGKRPRLLQQCGSPQVVIGALCRYTIWVDSVCWERDAAVPPKLSDQPGLGHRERIGEPGSVR